MASTANFQAKTIFMTQNCTHVRVGSSAEFKIAAGGHLLMGYEQCTGKSGTASNRGVTYFLTTAQASSFYIRKPEIGSYKQLLFNTKALTSGGFRVRTTAKTISIGRTSHHSFRVRSSFGKGTSFRGQSLMLYGISTAKWMIVNRIDRVNSSSPLSSELRFIFSSSTGT